MSGKPGKHSNPRRKITAEPERFARWDVAAERQGVAWAEWAGNVLDAAASGETMRLETRGVLAGAYRAGGLDRTLLTHSVFVFGGGGEVVACGVENVVDGLAAPQAAKDCPSCKRCQRTWMRLVVPFLACLGVLGCMGEVESEPPERQRIEECTVDFRGELCSFACTDCYTQADCENAVNTAVDECLFERNK